MRFYTTDFRSITCHIPNTFDTNDITRAADAINELGCLAYPLILEQTGVESFDVTDNAFYYYAVERAIELGGSHEMVNSMIAEDARYARASQSTKATLTPSQTTSIAIRQSQNAPTLTIADIAANNRNRLRAIMFQSVAA